MSNCQHEYLVFVGPRNLRNEVRGDKLPWLAEQHASGHGDADDWRMLFLELSRSKDGATYISMAHMNQICVVHR